MSEFEQLYREVILDHYKNPRGHGVMEDADASAEDIKALVAQSQKRSAVYDIITNPTNVTVEVA